MSGLQELVVEQHTLAVSVRVTFLSSSGKVSESLKRMVAQELDEHLATAFKRRDLIVLEISENEIAVA